MIVPVHCMQGRLLPPRDDLVQAFPAESWEHEFSLAAKAGVQGIEWIYEVHGADANPLATDAGIKQMLDLCLKYQVAVESLCADWFMDRPLLHGDLAAGEEKLVWLVERAATAGIQRIVVPFVDASRLRGARDVERLTGSLGRVVDQLELRGVELHLETDLPPDAFAKLLRAVDHPFVLANYDTGNSAALGFEPREEFDAYGDRIGSVHIKDRLRDGGTVPLGEGDAQIDVVLSRLRQMGWRRPLVLQVARGPEGEEPLTVRAQARTVLELWERLA